MSRFSYTDGWLFKILPVIILFGWCIMLWRLNNITNDNRAHDSIVLCDNNINHILPIVTSENMYIKSWISLSSLNIHSIINDLQHNQASFGNVRNKSHLEQEFISNIETINWAKDIPPHYVTCHYTRSPKPPIGIPPLYLNYDAIHFKALPFFLDIDTFCIVHSNGFLSDFSVFNQHQYYRFHNEVAARPRMYINKPIRYLMTQSASYLNTDVPGKYIDIAIRLDGWGAGAFSLFNVFVVPQFAMIYQLIENIKSETLSYTNNHYHYYNICLVTHYSKPTSFNRWFWEQFKWKYGVNVVNAYLTISLIETANKQGAAKADVIYYSPLVISPVWFRSMDKFYAQSFNKLGKIFGYKRMLPTNCVLPIKPHICNTSIADRNIVMYLDRGTRKKRSVENNVDVIDYLKRWCINKTDHNGNALEFLSSSDVVFHKNRDHIKNIFSSIAILIGPHGGAFANVNLMQPGSFVVEFIDYWTNATWGNAMQFRSYYSLSQANALKYYYLKPIHFHWDKPMRIGMGHLEQLMEQIYARIKIEGFAWS